MMFAEIINFFQEWWGTPVVGTVVAIIGGLYIPGFRVWLFKFFKAALSTTVIKFIFLSALKALVESTKTTWDDELYELIVNEAKKKDPGIDGKVKK